MLLLLLRLALLFFRPGDKELSREKSILPRFSLGEAAAAEGGGEEGGAMLVKAGGSLRGLLMLRGLLLLLLLLLLPSAWRISRTSADRSRLALLLLVVAVEGEREKEVAFFLVLSPPPLPVRGEEKGLIFFISPVWRVEKRGVNGDLGGGGVVGVVVGGGRQQSRRPRDRRCSPCPCCFCELSKSS
jgi:hypothetical protein